MKTLFVASVISLSAYATAAIAECSVSVPDLALELPAGIEIKQLRSDGEHRQFILNLPKTQCYFRMIGKSSLPETGARAELKNIADSDVERRGETLRYDWNNENIEIKRSSEVLPDQVILELAEFIDPNKFIVTGTYLMDDTELAFGSCVSESVTEDVLATALTTLRAVRNTSTLEACTQ